MNNLVKIALIIIDVQLTFDNPEYWGKRDNPAAESNIRRLANFWTLTNQPIVMVTHTSSNPESTFHPENTSSKLKPFLEDLAVDLEVSKTVNSAFLGTPDLNTWLRDNGIREVVICGIQTNMCVETSTRMAGNLGLRTVLVLDACHTFGLLSLEGQVIPAELLSRITATNLHAGRFARVLSTEQVLLEQSS